MKKVLHFGAGALGRGLTIYSLVHSNCEVYIADTNETLIDALKKNNNTYRLHCVDAEPENQHQEITVHKVLSMNNDMDEIKRLLREEIDTVTTSVIQENLIHVAKIIAEVWNIEDAGKYMILLCENIESASTYFQNLLITCAHSKEQRDNLMNIRIPDTMVDRGCGKNPKDILEVVTTEFKEIAVDKRVVEDTGIEFIPAIDHIDSIFARKRFLLNTLSDAIAFTGILYHCESFEEATLNSDVRYAVLPYMDLVRQSLVVGYGLSEDYVRKWSDIYEKRLGLDRSACKHFKHNKLTEQSRGLSSIARNMLRKLELDERFVKPIILLWQNDPTADLDIAIAFIAKIAQYEKDMRKITKEALLQKLHEMWYKNEAGIYVYQKVSNLII